MADGYRLVQHTNNSFRLQHTSKSSAVANDAYHLTSLLNQFLPELPSPSKSPDPGLRGQGSQGMYNQNHQQGHNSRLNGNHAGRGGMPILYNFQQPAAHHQQGHAQHQHGLQQDHASHNTNTSVLGHHSGFSSGVLSNTSPFASSIQNGHTATTRGGQAQQINEHWAEQLRLHKESEAAHAAMVEQNQVNYYARLKAGENKGIGGPALNSDANNAAVDGEIEGVRRPVGIDKSTQRQDWHNLDLSGQGLRALAPALFNYTFLHELYIASNKLTVLPPAIGELRALRLLEASNNQLQELPAELGMCTMLKQLLLFNNRIQDLPTELGFLHRLEVLGVEGNPLNQEMKKKIVEEGTKSLVNWLRERSPVPLPPLERKVITIQEDVSPSLERVKVLSWNILCERYATQAVYGYTPTSALTWDYRRDLILEEIRRRDADILCLQEVNTEAMREDFGPELAKEDYRGIHWPRSKAKTMAEKDAIAVDGCAIFFKQSKYICLDKQLIDFGNIAINRPDMKNQHDIFNRVMPKDNIAILGFFESRQTGARMIVVNAHLAWEGTLNDVKIIQTAIIMEFVTKQAEKYARWPAVKDKRMISIPTGDDEADARKEPMPEPGPSQEYRNNTDIPLFVCGDYNSPADSGVNQLLSTGHLAPDYPDLVNHHYGTFTRDGIEHPFSLRSAYQHLDGTVDALPFTNYTPTFADCIDYIWYSTNTLEVVELVGPPDPQYLKRVPGFPNYHFPSDHIQLVSEFVIKPRKDKKGNNVST